MKPEPRAEAVLCRYHYDALDRLAAATPLAEATVQRIYQKNRLSVEIQGAVHRRVMQFDDHVLAEQRAAETVLPATDLQRSVLHSVDAQGQQGIAYSPYGHRPSGSDVFSLLGFAGERPDPVTGHYPLGKGYRAYNPVLMRFNQPDSLSPFGEGGVNAYAYCQGDPVNRSDPTGHTWWFLIARAETLRWVKTFPAHAEAARVMALADAQAASVSPRPLLPQVAAVPAQPSVTPLKLVSNNSPRPFGSKASQPHSASKALKRLQGPNVGQRSGVSQGNGLKRKEFDPLKHADEEFVKAHRRLADTLPNGLELRHYARMELWKKGYFYDDLTDYELSYAIEAAYDLHRAKAKQAIALLESIRKG